MGIAPSRTSTLRSNHKISCAHHDKKNFSNIYWQGPVAMFGALIAALLLALAHHFFYQHLDGRPVSNYFLSQAWVNNVATGLAFATKMFFVIAAGMAYVEWQWRELVKKEHKLEQVDALTSVLDDATNFFQIRTWFRNPFLLLLAIITWSLPIAAIFTPGTLSVQAFRYYNHTTTGVPEIKYEDTYSYVQRGGFLGFHGPSAELSRVSMASSTSGQILSIPLRNANQSYTLQFCGPSLRCAVSENQGIFGVAREEGVYQNSSKSDLPEQYGFIALVPGDLRGILGTTWTSIINNTADSFTTLDVVSNDTARIYIMPSQTSENVSQSALIECQLWNASYSTNLSFQFPYQDVSVTSLEYLNPVNGKLGDCGVTAGGPVVDCPAIDRLPPEHLIYQAIMQSFGDVIVGVVYYPDAGSTDDSTAQIAGTSKRLTAVDWDSTETARYGLEQLFQNITLSAMSSSKLTNESSSADENATGTAVVVATYLNRYVYTPRNLLLAYGISFLVTFVCTLAGFYAMWHNQGSFHNSVSTFIRAAWHRNSNSNVQITDYDRGVKPIPRDVAATRIRLGGPPQPPETKTFVVLESTAGSQQDPNQVSQAASSASSLHSALTERLQRISSPVSRVSTVSEYSRLDATASDVESDAESNQGTHGRH